jgi:hypothetical protein
MGSQTIAVKAAAGVMGLGRLLNKYFYFGMSLLIAAVVIFRGGG